MKGQLETAFIYLNEDNARLLEKQLLKQQHMTVAEFQKGGNRSAVFLHRYNRMEHLQIPPIHFFQLEVEYTMELGKKKKNIDKAIDAAITDEAKRADEMIAQDLSGHILESQTVAYGIDTVEAANFLLWLNEIVKESFGTLSLDVLCQHEKSLHGIYRKITMEQNGQQYYRKSLIQSVVRANIRKAFVEEWHYKTKNEIIPMTAGLLNVTNLQPIIETVQPQDYYPEQRAVENIMQDDDDGKFAMSDRAQAAIEYLEKSNPTEANRIKIQEGLLPNKDRSFHYLPYHMDSNMEIDFLREFLPEDIMVQRNLEIYYNGDRSLTEFRIKCYEKRSVRDWAYVGMYTPDFLILQRKAGRIDRVIIVETKGSLYAKDPNFIKRRHFMESVFTKENPNFSYLYLEDSMDALKRRQLTRDAITRFFQEVH
jgi:hypothetical protein